MKSFSLERSRHTKTSEDKDESTTFTPKKNIMTAWPKNPYVASSALEIREKSEVTIRVKSAKDIHKKLINKIQNPEYGLPIREPTKTFSTPKIRTPISESATTFMRTTETFLSNPNEASENYTCTNFKDLINSKMISQKTVLDRSYKISQLRKRNEDFVRPEKPKIEMKNSYSSPKLANNKTLTRFVDQLILAGTLPLEAVEYFTPENNTLMKSDEKSAATPTNSHSKKASISIKSPRNAAKESANTAPAVDVIPGWLKTFPQFSDTVGGKKKHTQDSIPQILQRKSHERDLTQTTNVAKWLSKIQFFQEVPYEKLVDIGKALEVINLKEGQALCRVGDPADSAYIVYDGQIEIYTKPKNIESWMGSAGPGEFLGKQALDKPGVRTAKLVASKPTCVISLGRHHYRNIIGEIKTEEYARNSLIYDFVTQHDFLKTFSEVKKHMLTNNVSFKKYLKNESVYQMDSPSNEMYIVVKGKVVRRMPVTIDKTNKWPTGLKDWRICKIIKTYFVTLPIQTGEIFGVSEMIDVSKRKEHVLVEEDAEILILTRDLFYQIFEEEDVFKFQKKVHEDDKKKAEKIKRMFEQQEKLHKIKSSAMTDAFNFNLNNKTHYSFREITEKTAEWKKLEQGMTKVKSKDKKVVSVQEVIKDVHSVYET